MKSRAIAVATCLSLTACGATSRGTHASGVGAESAQVEQSGALRLLMLERPLGATIALSLWLDAGAFDGPNASHALIAASIASSRTGLEMRVTPDGTSFRQLCTRAELGTCFDRFDDALRLRETTEEEFAVALSALRVRRERALGDSSRASLNLAVQSLLGYEVHPLGDTEDVITRESLGAFLRAHYGANRALVIAVGSAEHGSLHEASMRIDGPLADGTRITREAREGELHAFDTSHLPPSWTFAVRGTSERDARGRAAAWVARMGREDRVTLFPTRLGWVATLTLQGDDPAALARAATWMRARASEEELRDDDDAWSLSNRHGDAWSAQPQSAAPGVAFAGAGRARVDVVEELDSLLAPRTAELVREGRVTRLTLDGTVMRVVDRLGGERGSVEVRFEGAAADGPRTGASIIAFEALGDLCLVGAEATLDGASLRVTVRDHVESLAERAARLIDCVASHSPSDVELDRARRARMASSPSDAERLAIVGRLLSPQAPGWVLPQGSRTSLAETSLDEVTARIHAWRETFEVRVGWPTELNDEAALGLAQRILPPRIEHAPPFRASAPNEPMEGDMVRVEADLPVPEVILAMRVDGAGQQGSGEGACVALESWARARAEAPTWRAGGEAEGWSWCAVALRTMPPGDAPNIPLTQLRDELSRASAHAAEASDLSRADVAGAARALLGDANAPLAASLRVTFRLARVEPSTPPLRRR